jgi:hypothetical protein
VWVQGGLLAWAERTGRRQAAQPGRGALRFAFYGRVSTEDYQDPVTSQARQLGQAGVVHAFAPGATLDIIRFSGLFSRAPGKSVRAG